MKKSKKNVKYQIHTDLAIEKGDKNNSFYKEITIDNIKVTSNLSNYQKNAFITIEFDDVADYENQKNISKVLTTYLKKLMNNLEIKNTDKCLVVGLGNQLSTPDSLGPNVIEEIIVTSHLFNLEDFIVDNAYRNVSAIAPKVITATGLETYKYVKTIVKNFKPDFLIIIDALVAKSFSRVNRIIQITNSGIQPGSGLEGFQKEITQKSLGIPVIAIGVPTVIGAEIIVNETINYILDNTVDNVSLKNLENMEEKDIEKILDKILYPLSTFMVTPKDIDFVIKKLSKIIAEGINNALHKKQSNNQVDK